MDNWIQPSLSFTQNVRCFASIGTTLFAGCDAGHVYKSTDNGASWTECSTGLPGYNVVALAVIGTKIFAGLRTGTAIYLDNGVYLSTDNCATWNAVNTGLPDLRVWALCSKGTELFVGLNSDIYKSTNDGTLWTYTGIAIFGGTISSVIVHGTDLWAGGYTYGPYLSTDDGATWAPKYTGIYGLGLQVTAMVFSGSNIFAATVNAVVPYPMGIFISTDGGTTWNTCNTGLGNLTVYGLILVNGVLYAATAAGIYSSLNNGALWELSGLSSLVANTLFYFNNSIYAGMNATVFLLMLLQETIQAIFI